LAGWLPLLPSPPRFALTTARQYALIVFQSSALFAVNATVTSPATRPVYSTPNDMAVVLLLMATQTVAYLGACILLDIYWAHLCHVFAYLQYQTYNILSRLLSGSPRGGRRGLSSWVLGAVSRNYHALQHGDNDGENADTSIDTGLEISEHPGAIGGAGGSDDVVRDKGGRREGNMVKVLFIRFSTYRCPLFFILRVRAYLMSL